MHRDLKPANVLLDGRGVVRITDFLLTVFDADAAGTGDADKLRMKITTSAGAVVYDTQSGDPDGSGPTAALGGGSIVVHSPKPGSKPKWPGAPDLQYTLSSGQPNPFSLDTEIHYALHERSNVAIDLFDLSGRRVASLVNGDQEGGSYSVRLSRQDRTGNSLSGGVYFVRMTASSIVGGAHFEATRRLVVLN